MSFPSTETKIRDEMLNTFLPAVNWMKNVCNFSGKFISKKNDDEWKKLDKNQYWDELNLIIKRVSRVS